MNIIEATRKAMEQGTGIQRGKGKFTKINLIQTHKLGRHYLRPLGYF